MSTPARSVAMDHATTQALARPEELYLDLLKKCLTRLIFAEDEPQGAANESRVRSLLRAVYTPVPRARHLLYGLFMRHAPGLYPPLRKALDPLLHKLHDYETSFSIAARAEGRDWPADAETMIGLPRLDNLQFCITDVLRRGVPGDLIEAGVWRGGATIFMRGVLKAYGDTDRTVWVADSFQGLPKPNARQAPADRGDILWTYGYLAVPLETVQRNFARYGLLDSQVRFLVGWFRDTLPGAPIDRLAVLRLDGDMYESTMDALRALYPKLSVGGYIIIDDYECLSPCKQAVDDYRAEHGITEPLQYIDWTGVFWQRLK
jgi:O-methyltransferase